ncbi:MAG: 30S ribosomal protein S8 [Candidatus Portnoybacteria bacterium RIFCSPLOWO2_01_FULL_43_11]|uniref:Small ribosomal subunit protein uS8 n=4 Tax=Candidatus Portnoyibacteriota TaxID=1817913 RepID=A0A1G2FCM4_9BACT|nr:MAG: 30S ribosomal protein S8 [Candidatus Portnoybacteria bacterium RIFCSPHIGHO2_01_FULL_40_12b]OGZ36191.1 MAG: 30S ribosomal protein S8 [Candidatus Portnoybacteria bacterium RIFCSPHIGHO2_02_FULL_40_23]OGZ38849.1 MAG: 30S ribosomal protein S8 [Candidatus Portnoybacteria bacterium RIFCSPLOWO2_01_FULL_43_11]OGZ39439.1 MAG: 30S ribosomal protein S8 [Candidatus Portnoybacteria bacterium RIFCSPHIGHO2_12_FULL_40_11]OGZ40537.1 MAG: 30S ribosomal protein S8 [Candidatus Portnoybacteria bacterium RIFC
MTDPISDMLTRIRNAQAVSHETVSIPFSKFKLNLAKILEKEGLVEGVLIQGRKIKKIIEIKLKYKNKKPVINKLKRISKPGQRIYLNKNMIRPIKQGYGLAVISTPEGLITDKEARKRGLGGEVICEVW